MLTRIHPGHSRVTVYPHFPSVATARPPVTGVPVDRSGALKGSSGFGCGTREIVGWAE